MYHIHFICNGNTFRSRLAEAYLRSKELPEIEATSSGFHAVLDRMGPITPYATRLAKLHSFEEYLQPHWDQLTQEGIDDVLLQVIMYPSIFEKVRNAYDLGTPYEVWDIPDVDDVYPGRILTEDEICMTTDIIFVRLRERVDELAARLAPVHGVRRNGE
ncbi:MAG: hypothetical protein ACP5OR_06345 [Candidatus Dormibacteria bacterium]